MDFTLISFIALSLTGMFIMSFGSLFTWLLSAFMSVSRWTLLLPILIGAVVLWGSIELFYSRIH